ncbi:MAG: alpha/beta hydrolase [Anaerolineales bacterium]
MTQYVQVSTDRRLAYCEYGDPNGEPVFYFHGTPGSRYEPAYGDQAARAFGYCILALDRPGIGQSDYVKERRLLDWPQDVKAVAERLGLDKFGVMGASGGGPYALACCYAMPERIAFSALMGSWGPVAAEPALWQEMAPLDQFFGKLSSSAPWVFYAPFSLLGYAAKWMSPQSFAKTLQSSMSAADQRLIADEQMARFFTEDMKEAYRQGVRGPADDAIILYRDWGFDVGEIKVAVHLFHGEQDRFAPYSHAMYLDEQLAQSTLHAYPGEGHLFLVKLFNEVFDQVSQPV